MASKVLAVGCLMVSLAGCADMRPRERNMAIGAGVSGVVGNIVKGGSTLGTAVGIPPVSSPDTGLIALQYSCTHTSAVSQSVQISLRRQKTPKHPRLHLSFTSGIAVHPDDIYLSKDYAPLDECLPPSIQAIVLGRRTNCLWCDDHAVVREGLKNILTEAMDMEVRGEAADGLEALQMMRSQNWDVVLLDISMQGKNGLDVLKAIHAEKPSLRILMLSIYAESQYALRSLKAGASGYLSKESALGQLIAVIWKVAQGHKYFSAELTEKMA